MHISKPDLFFYDYEWNDSKTPNKLMGVPDRNLYHRFGGADVLYMINYTCEALECKTKRDAVQLEMLLHEKLPLELTSQNSVFAWLVKNYHLIRQEQTTNN